MKNVIVLIVFAISICYAETTNSDTVKRNADAAFKKLDADIDKTAAKWQITISENAKLIHSIRSSFKQVKHLSFLSEKVVSEGKFIFSKGDVGNRLKWEYRSPFSYTIVIDGQKITMKDGNKVSRFDMSSSRVFEEINDIMVKSLNGTILSDSKNFDFTITDDGKHLTIQMVPLKGTSMSDYFKSIKMVMDKTDFTVDTLIMTENSGDFTELVFTEKTINGKVNENDFVVE